MLVDESLQSPPDSFWIIPSESLDPPMEGFDSVFRRVLLDLQTKSDLRSRLIIRVADISKWYLRYMYLYLYISNTLTT